MSRKKRRLWLNKPKRISFKATKNKYALLNDSRNLHGNTPPSSKKHQCTPSKVRTPKRKKLSSYTNDDQNSPTTFSHLLIFLTKTISPNTFQKVTLDCSDVSSQKCKKVNIVLIL